HHPSRAMTDPVPIPSPGLACPHCGHLQWVRPKYLGRQAKCKKCDGAFSVPGHILIPCPHCKRNLKAGPSYFGRRVACTFCNEVFQLSPYIHSPCPSCKRTLQVRP